MVRHDMPGTIKPEVRDLVQYPTFVRNRVRKHDIERGQAIRRDDEHPFGIYGVDIADLTLMNPLEVAQSGAEHGLRLIWSVGMRRHVCVMTERAPGASPGLVL